jgi:hypothetical protein
MDNYFLGTTSWEITASSPPAPSDRQRGAAAAEPRLPSSKPLAMLALTLV